MKLKIGDKVFIVSCDEAVMQQGNVFEVVSIPYMIDGAEAVKIKCEATGKYYGRFLTMFLEKINSWELTMESYDSSTDTIEHIECVRKYIDHLEAEIAERAFSHDETKLISPEKEVFDEFTPKLANTTYGSDEYKEHLKGMGKALEHHYSANRHHPEHFENGIKDMDLVDIVEMLCDWKSASMRHNDGDVLKSIEINQQRFGYSDELKSILINTLKYF